MTQPDSKRLVTEARFKAISDASATAAVAQAQSDLDAAAAAAASSATAAQNSANLVGAPADTAIATAVAGAGTQTRTALDGRYAPRYYDDAATFTDRGSVFTISRNVAAPSGLQPTVWVNVSGKGDNTTFKGVAAGQFLARDRTDVTAANKGVIYGIQAVVAPIVDRNNVPFDDCVGISIENQGSGVGTDALYFGHNRSDKATNPAARDFSNIIQIDMNSSSVLRSIGAHDVGISFGSATFTTTAIRLGNTQTIAWNDSAGNVVHSLRLTSSGTLRLYEGGIDIRSDKSVYTNQKVVLPNASPLRAIKAAGGTEQDLIKLTATDAISIGTNALQVFASGDVALPNNKAFQALNAAGSTYLELMRLTGSDNVSLNGGRAVLLAAGGLLVQNVTAVPSLPTGAGALYVEAGALKFKGTSGTITTIAPA